MAKSSQHKCYQVYSCYEIMPTTRTIKTSKLKRVTQNRSPHILAIICPSSSFSNGLIYMSSAWWAAHDHINFIGINTHAHTHAHTHTQARKHQAQQAITNSENISRHWVPLIDVVFTQLADCGIIIQKNWLSVGPSQVCMSLLLNSGQWVCWVHKLCLVWSYNAKTLAFPNISSRDQLLNEL